MSAAMSIAQNRRVAVVGAGMVGLSTAWFLQEHGVHVTVMDRRHVAAGSSWGNAGWLTPSLTTPLPEPGVFTYGLRAVFNASSPVYVPLRPQRKLLRFLAGFALHSTEPRWNRAMRAYAPINAMALEAFDELADGGVQARTQDADPFLACYHKRSNVESTFSMIKAKFGDSLRSKTETAQVNEALCKVLAHNICCLIQSMYELDIKPEFWRAA